MPYPTYDRQMMADFTGRPVASFPLPYVEASAIPQALLLFKIGTCIADPSGLSEEAQQAVNFAIISMADAIHLAAPYQTVLASPFNSESIGSYSYSKAVKAVQAGLPTGVPWFDIAVQELSQCDTSDGIAMTGGIQVFENTGGWFAPGNIGQNLQFLTPADILSSRAFGHDPAPGWAYASIEGGTNVYEAGE